MNEIQVIYLEISYMGPNETKSQPNGSEGEEGVREGQISKKSFSMWLLEE
jgi:hypothetical protein